MMNNSSAIQFSLIKENSWLSNLLKDARHFQIIYLSTFLTYGILALNWEISALQLTAVIGSSLVTQFLWLKLHKKNMSGLKSALITALGLCLILKSSSLLTLVVAAVVAISSKFILRIKDKHLFNPANFGIIFSIAVLGDAWISPGQWGSSAIFLFCLTVLGGIVLMKIGRLETSLVFIGTLFLLEYSRTVLYQGWEMDVLYHKFSSGTLLLFTFFMITDPMTIPNSRKARVFWSIILATATFILGNYVQIYTAPIWVLFFMTPITVFFDKILPAGKFEWLAK
ncbi:RnfABCDGE type electron transport complex subunit D [Paracrocinitomix mangrovi]|uniref:RnfABCDGE type electron transport complex subunit D n=1 Tax=Paracrocinitomix mangrovi TaxID=2862509 RepID=UPI001C8D8C15|nr:RnfABCDGE type electron transport complex subunit D [Paracrocinitomix mangrovi]UKN02350.1 RnfABCDGE type electron transport complex subunit D [Paracrocinitomix mangrovi]